MCSDVGSKQEWDEESRGRVEHLDICLLGSVLTAHNPASLNTPAASEITHSLPILEIILMSTRMTYGVPEMVLGGLECIPDFPISDDPFLQVGSIRLNCGHANTDMSSSNTTHTRSHSLSVDL